MFAYIFGHSASPYAPRNRLGVLARIWRVAALAMVAPLGAAPATAQGAKTLLERAVACDLHERELATLIDAAGAEDAGMKQPAQTLAAPSGNLYRLTKPVGAFGYSASEIYVAPGRVVLAVPKQALDNVIAKLKLTAEPYGPAERRIDTSRSIIAYRLSQAPLADKTLVGCAYADPAALTWLGQDDRPF